ncbi:hypothetical protein BBK82_30920 [Lentzea guizhouensis]|uniref:Uncharacterized protein n=1 Tax=Lentzea guizhouensis TaxID=1586287 RepID=A0A1B2HPZ2_9PSEU|nr:hypothetical protein [Lentzea guizhouensis]ANZ39799.1 hypothetical protein BBK82_30920 [Lentzea guizhouensis]
MVNRFSGGVAAVIAATALVIVPVEAGADDRGGSVVITADQDCYEFAERTRITLDQARKLIPARYTAQESPDARGMVDVFMGDYACKSISLNGKPGRPTMVTMASVNLATRDGKPVPQGTAFPLWWGTDHKELARAVQRLGAPARVIEGKQSVKDIGGGKLHVTNAYWGDKVDHVRTAVVPDLSKAPLHRVITPTGYYQGERGEVQFVYDMKLHVVFGAADLTTVSHPRSDIVTQYGFPQVYQGPTDYLVGTWTLKIELKRRS